MKSLNICSSAATIARSTSITLTVVLAMNVLGPQAYAGWFKQSPKVPAITVEDSRGLKTYQVIQKQYPSLKFETNKHTGNIVIRGGSGFRPDVDTGMKKIKALGVPDALTLMNDKKDISSYEVKGTDKSELIVLNMEQGSVLILRVRLENNFYDHVMKIPMMTDKITEHSIQITQTHGGEDAIQDISLKLVLENGQTQTLKYQSQLKKSMEDIELPSVHENFARLLKSQEEVIELKAKMQESIFGQDHALERLTFHILETKTNGMDKPKVLLAQGPSGVGKSFMAKTLVDLAYNDADHFLEISGAQHNAGTHALDHTDLFGSKASDGAEGTLPTFIRKSGGKGVLVINEADKMHPDMWKRMMEFIEKGRLTDNKGQELWAKDIVIILTSNRGSTKMFPSSVSSWSQEEIDQRLAGLSQEELKSYYMNKEGSGDDRTLPREILNRIDEIIAFGPLSKEAAVKIAKATADKLGADYRMKYGINLTADPALIEYIALTGFKASDDARQIARQVKLSYTSAFSDGIKKIGVAPGSDVHLSLSENEKHQKFIGVSGNGKTMDLPVRQTEVNLLDNPEKIQRLLQLANFMKSRVIGQDVTMTELAKGVQSYEVRPDKARPFTAFLIGTSGNGKTETARALAEYEFRNADRVAILSMGNISNMNEYGNVMGVGSEFQSGDRAREFEKILENNPNGCVIVMDEISNMGGNDPGMRSSMLKKLYELFEEGKYVSPSTGKTYDLSKYKMILTGNDGEQLFDGITSDDMLLETWENNRDPEKVRRMLRELGLPNAMINRMSMVALMKPLLSNEVQAVATKLWNREATAFEKKYQGIKITTAEGFNVKLAKAFFAADQGARGIRSAIENNFGSLFLNSLAAGGVDPTNLRNISIVVDLEDNRLTKPYQVRSAPERKVDFVAQIYQNNKFVDTVRVDGTEASVKQYLMSSKMARAVAYHEAGHAMANDPEVTGEKTEYVTIFGGRTKELEYYGYARPKEIKGAGKSYDRERVIAMIARLAAGRISQEMAGFNADAGWSNDLEKIRKITSLYLTKWGLDPELKALPLNDKNEPIVAGPAAELFNLRQQQMIAEGEQMATQMLQERWRAVRAMAAELLLNGEIKEARIDDIYNKLVTDKDPTVRNYDWDYFKYQKRGQFANKCSSVHF